MEKDVIIRLRVSREMKQQLEAYAKNFGFSMSLALRQMIAESLSEEGFQVKGKWSAARISPPKAGKTVEGGDFFVQDQRKGARHGR